MDAQRNLAQRPSLPLWQNPAHFQGLCPPPHPSCAETPCQGLSRSENSSWVLGQVYPWTPDTLTRDVQLDVREISCHCSVTGTHPPRSQKSWPVTSEPSGSRTADLASAAFLPALDVEPPFEFRWHSRVQVVTFLGFCPCPWLSISSRG